MKAEAKFAAAQSATDAFGSQLKAVKVKYDVGLARMSDVLDALSAFDSSITDSVIANKVMRMQYMIILLLV